MRSSLTKLDIINLVRLKIGRGHSDPRVDKDMELIYTSRYEYLLSMFPWGFATDAVQLEGRLLTGGDLDRFGYRYEYTFPIDGLFMWDIYYDPIYRKYNNLPTFWNGRQYPYLDFPIQGLGELGLDSTLGEIISDKFYSDFEQMYCFYTSNKEISPSKFSSQFVKLIENSMEEFLNRGRSDNEGKLGYIEAANRKENNRAKAVVSNENKGIRTVPRSQTLSRIDSLA